MSAPDIARGMLSTDGFRPYFKDGVGSWGAWMAFFKVLAGRKDLSDAEMEIFTRATGLRELPSDRIREVFLCCGRRSGKSTVSALMAVAYGIWGDWQKGLQGGEQPMIFIISPTMAQGQIILRYIEAILSMPQFKGFLKRAGRESLELRNGVRLEIKPASWRSTRGWSCGLVILEELAFFRFETESANVDTEIYNALRPSTEKVRDSLIVGISTPYVRQGLLWQKSQRWGKPGPVLFWRMPTWLMNPTLSEESLRADYVDMSPAEFNSEFGAMEREDIAAFLPVGLIDKAMSGNYDILGPERGRFYRGFCDPSEGLRKGADSMTFAVAHAEEEGAVVDLLLEFQPPFRPRDVISEIVRACGRYGIQKVVQDSHAIAWIGDQLEPFEITVEPSDLSKSEIYGQFSVLANNELVLLPASPRLRTQLMGLFRQETSSGPKIDHLRNGHDDLSNAACGAAVLARGERAQIGPLARVIGDVSVDGPGCRGDEFPHFGSSRSAHPSDAGRFPRADVGRAGGGPGPLDARRFRRGGDGGGGSYADWRKRNP